MKKLFLLYIFLASGVASAGFQGEFCSPDDESYLLKSKVRITRQSQSSAAEFSFVRTDAEGEETDVKLLEGQDFKMQVLEIAREFRNEEKVKCEDGHESILSSGAADIAFVFEFTDQSVLSKAIRKKSKNGKFKTNLSCQWTAEEKPCAK